MQWGNYLSQKVAEGALGMKAACSTESEAGSTSSHVVPCVVEGGLT